MIIENDGEIETKTSGRQKVENKEERREEVTKSTAECNGKRQPRLVLKINIAT